MRKLNKKARRSIWIFGAVVFLTAAFVAGGAVRVIASKEEAYPVRMGDFVFDNTYTAMEVRRDGYIRKSWNSEYVLESGDNRYVLGKNTIGYSPADNQVKVYGSGYLLKEDGTVTTLGRYYGAENERETQFIKLDDNKFVVCSDNIVSDDGLLNTGKFVYVVLDRVGNARLINHMINVKMLGNAKISAGSLIMDMEEKTLNFAGNLLGLDQVKGYIGEGGEVYDLFIRGGAGGKGGAGGTGGTGGMGGVGGIGGLGGAGGMGGAGGIGGLGGMGGVGGAGGMGGMGGLGGAGGVTEEEMKLMTSMYIRRADAAANAITCNFNIYDPFNVMGAAEFHLWEKSNSVDTTDPEDLKNKTKSMAASAGDTVLTYADLKPNTEYIIAMGYVDEEGFHERDRINTRTLKYNCAVSVVELRENSYNFVAHLDPGMDKISKVTVSCEGTEVKTWEVGRDTVLPSALEAMMTFAGYEHRVTGVDLKTDHPMLNLNLKVEFFDGVSNPVLADISVVNPFYRMNPVAGASIKNSNDATAVSEEEYQNVVKELDALKDQVKEMQGNTADDKKTETNDKKTETDDKKTETNDKKTETNGTKTETDAPKTETGATKTETGGTGNKETS